MKMEKSSERYFFEYAFPCAGVLVNIGKISKEEYLELEKTFLDSGTPSRERMEWMFSSAFRRIRKLAEDSGKNDYWDKSVLKDYWLWNHNQIIDEGEGNYSKTPVCFNDYCKVNMGEVMGVDEGVLTVSCGFGDVLVDGVLLQNVSVGDVVTIHHSYAVEKI
jgi:hypothetical protein